MYQRELDRHSIAPSALTARAVAAFFVTEIDDDGQRIALPRPEVQIVVRFGPAADNGLDIHALGTQQRVRRKLLRGGQRAVMARLRLGASMAVLGVPASAVAGSVVALEELWSRASVERLLDRLSNVKDGAAAITAMEHAIAERLASAKVDDARAAFAVTAAEKLVNGSVGSVAKDFGFGERHFRRTFREAVGMSPKEFARLARFRRALRAAREDRGLSWASIAAETGYYDQAHLIEEFRAIAGVTPRSLLGELGFTPGLRPAPVVPAVAAE